MSVKNIFHLSILIAFALLHACSDPDPMISNGTTVDIDELLESDLVLNMNPQGKTPLAGEIKMHTERFCDVVISLREDPTVQFSSTNKKVHEFKIVGLFADALNTLDISVRTVDSLYIASTTLDIQTEVLPDFFPDIEILSVQTSEMEKGWNLVELNIGGPDGFQFYPIVFDELGRIRYYIDLTSLDGWIGPLVFNTDNSWSFGQFNYLDKYDLLLNRIDGYKFGDHFIHHDFFIKDNGNMLLLTSAKDADTVQDRLIEYNPNSKTILNTWDFREFLDVDRNEMNWNSSDWIHTNSISYNKTQELNIFSGRYQGVIAVDNNQNLKWILGPHKGWGKAGVNGDSFETSNYLLTAVDSDLQAYSENVQLGLENAADFSWPWGQHACHSMENGNVICFDNGWKTNFSGNGGFSRIVEYEIDPVTMTARQVWEYGSERGADLHSTNISDVDVLPHTKNRLMIPGNITEAATRQSRVVEVKYPSKEVVFEAVIHFKNSFTTGNGWTQADLVYQGERIDFFK